MTTANEVVAWLRATADRKTLESMARYAIPSDRAFGVPVGVMKKHAKALGRDHALAAALWKTGHYEARMMAVFLDEPDAVTAAQMDAWCRDFDSWAIVDTACFHLFDRTPFAWKKVDAWATKKGEFQRRASYALLASLVAHDKVTPDAEFIARLPLLEAGAHDGRNFVVKGAGWALRSLARRKSLKAAVKQSAARLATSTDAQARAVGRAALK